jgi:hypothetical protein
LAFFLMNVMLMALGLWVGMFWSFRHFRWLPIGCSLILLGWLGIVFNDVVFSFAENAAEFFGVSGVSAPRYSGPKNINVLPIVVPELKLRNVQRHIFGADLMERADNTALHQRPETTLRKAWRHHP